MISIFKKNKTSIIIFLGFIFCIFLFSFLNYINIINEFILSILNNILVISVCLIFGIKKGIKRNKKGYLTGLKYGSIIVLILFIFGRILNFPLYFSNIIYYFIILFSITLGSIIGCNKNQSS